MDHSTPIGEALFQLAAYAKANTPLDGTTIEAIADRITKGDDLDTAYERVTAEATARYEVKWTDKLDTSKVVREAVRGGDRYIHLIRGILDNPQFTLISVRQLPD